MRENKEGGNAVSIPPIEEKLYNAIAEKEKNAVGAGLAAARKRTGMNLVEFSKYLEKFGVFKSATCVSKWETGVSTPNSYQLLALCSALGIDDVFGQLSSEPTDQLNEEGRKRLADYKDELIATGMYRPRPLADFQDNIRRINMPVSDLLVSAGLGNILDDSHFETMSFPASIVPSKADFGLRVSGDSMEPAYLDGQIVWVQKCDKLDTGEVGIFIYDGKGYLKSYGEQKPQDSFLEEFTDSYGVVHPQPVLISFNEKYKPLPVSPYEQFMVVGRVL